jgi:CelD/BcsL family acetyltransferase involved in cellulose biosynthesis
LNPQLYTGPAVFERLASEWNTLVQESIANTPFQRLDYQQSWWQHLGPGNLYTVAVRNDGHQNDGRLVGIGSFYLIDETLYFNGCVEESDYLDLIATPEHTEKVWELVLDCLDSDGMPRWNCIDLCNVPAASPTRDILPRLAESRGFSFSTEVHEVCPIIPLAGTFDDYLAGLDKKQRHEVRRKMRRAAEAGLEIQTVGPDDDIETAVNDFLLLLQKSHPDKAEWLNDGRTAHFHQIAAAAQANGTLQLMFAVMEGQQAATLFNYDYNGRIYVYNSGFDPDAFSHLSAGVVLTAKAIEWAIENGRHSFDFLRGNEVYKYRFGAEDTTVHRLLLRRNDSNNFFQEK